MAKQLRLDVAQLTDVGRRREHNEDNMAHVIPKDPQVMTKKGALFIVADGMGGHAAGEVASEIAVDTVSNAYYQDDSDDIAVSLLHAIKRTNALIYQRAAENMLRSGMGTTCVTAVLRGNMAYIANVGDSRAYLVRNGLARQLSQDHSWVAEQVRAGVLTEDQARTHAQRNVITRCLGTQAEVEIDVFSEELEEKDSLVLCSDGLSGFVSDEEILRIVEQSAPQESVYHLVERANENGGPDNITAIVVHVQEVGGEMPGARRPVHVGGRETDEDAGNYGRQSSSGSLSLVSSQLGESYSPSSPLHFAGSPLNSDTIITAPQPAIQSVQRSRGRLLYPTLALLLLFLLTLAGGGAYYYVQGNASSTLAQSLQSAQGLINTSNAEIATNPTSALQHLASAQTILRTLQQTGSLTPDQHQQVVSLLQGDLTRRVQDAITSYYTQAKITSLPCISTSTVSLTGSTTPPDVKALTTVQTQGKPFLYALGLDNIIYAFHQQTDALSRLASSFPAGSAVLDIAGYGAQLGVLASLPVKGSHALSYSLNLLTPGQRKVDATVTIAPALIKNGQIPKLLTVWGTDIYVVLASNPTQSSALILKYTPRHGKPLAEVAQSVFSVSAQVVSLVALPNQQLFLLLADGSVQSLLFTPGNSASTSVLLQHSIVSGLSITAQEYTWSMPVPAVTPVAQSGTPSLAIQPGATSPTTLAAGVINTVPHLYIMDVGLHRVLDLQVANGANSNAETPTTGTTPIATSVGTGGGVISTATPLSNGGNTLELQQQYISPNLFAQMKSMTADAQGTISILAADKTPALNITTFSTAPQNGCGQ